MKIFQFTVYNFIIIIYMYVQTCSQELIMWRGEYLTLYSPVIDDCAEVKQLPFRVT